LIFANASSIVMLTMESSLSVFLCDDNHSSGHDEQQAY